MDAPEFPKNEAERIAALRATGLLYTLPEERFDRITRLASQLLGTPIALVSLVAEKVQWFKSVQGLDATETAREISFCGHAILEEKTFVVEDALLDTRFADNPLVTSDPSIRFYAGQPLHTGDGSLVGTLCVIDQTPRQFTSEQMELLQDLGALVETEIQRGQLVDTLTTQNSQLQVEIQERINAEEALRETQNYLIAKEKLAALGALVAGIAHEINTPVGISVTAASHLREETEKLLNIYEKGAMKRKDLENYLSVSNNATSILEKNLRRASELVRSFKEIAVDQSTDDVRYIKLLDYINDIIISLRPKLKNRPIAIQLDIEPSLSVTMKSGALSQIMANLIINSLVHAYDDQDEGKIIIEAKANNEDLILTYQDDGKGMDAGTLKKVFDPFFTTKRGQGGSGLGMNIVYNIVTQILGGAIQCVSTPGQGVFFTLHIPGCFKN